MDRLASQRNDSNERRSPTAPPQGKYIPYSERFPLKLPDRTWPDKVIDKAPAWCAVDLRDGNQALPRPMTIDEKAGFFEVLKKVGFTQIEVGYPSANQQEYDFMRLLIEGKHIPSHITPQVLTADREKLIKRTFEALKGAHQAIVHIYRPTSIDQRELFFRMTKDEVMRAAVESTKLVRRLSAKVDFPVQLQFSPESFTGTEIEFALEVCNAVVNAWDPGSHEQVIINLPATVELSRPNIYADQIEWMNRHLKRRDQIILSLHNHNDRGTAVAATELGLQAGAERVEGTLFGNGERTGNLDLVNIAVNLYKEGIDPGIDLSNIPWMKEQYEKFTGMKVPSRHVVGDLAFTAFSGGHQAAIAPGLKYQKKASDPLWRVPYLGVDPKDFGMKYEPIQLTGQSGKHGTAFRLETKFGCEVPRAMLADVGAMAKEWTDAHPKGDLSDEIVWKLFHERYIEPAGELHLQNYTLTRDGMKVKAYLEVSARGEEMKTVTGTGNGPIDAATNALKQLGYSFDVQSFHEHSRGEGSSAEAVAYVQVSSGERSVFGVGIDANTEYAALEALVAGVNRLT